MFSFFLRSSNCRQYVLINKCRCGAYWPRGSTNNHFIKFMMLFQVQLPVPVAVYQTFLTSLSLMEEKTLLVHPPIHFQSSGLYLLYSGFLNSLIIPSFLIKIPQNAQFGGCIHSYLPLVYNIMKTLYLLSKLYVESKQSIVLNDKHVSKPLNHSVYRSNSLLLYLFGSSMTITLRQYLICGEWIKVHHTYM